MIPGANVIRERSKIPVTPCCQALLSSVRVKNVPLRAKLKWLCTFFKYNGSMMICAGHDMGRQREGAADAVRKPAAAEAGASTGARSKAFL